MKKKSKVIYKQKYRKIWEQEELFEKWLRPHEDKSRALCICCDCEVAARHKDLTRHALTQKHIKAIAPLYEHEMEVEEETDSQELQTTKDPYNALDPEALEDCVRTPSIIYEYQDHELKELKLELSDSVDDPLLSNSRKIVDEVLKTPPKKGKIIPANRKTMKKRVCFVRNRYSEIAKLQVDALSMQAEATKLLAESAILQARSLDRIATAFENLTRIINTEKFNEKN